MLGTVRTPASVWSALLTCTQEDKGCPQLETIISSGACTSWRWLPPQAGALCLCVLLIPCKRPTAPKGKWLLCCNECRWICKMQHSRYWSLVNYKGWDCPDSPTVLGFARDLRFCHQRSKWIGLGIVVQTSILIFPRQSPRCIYECPWGVQEMPLRRVDIKLYQYLNI